MVSIAPLFFRNCLLQFLFCCQGVSPLRHAQAMTYTKDVGIYRNSRHVVDNACNYVGSLFAYTRKLHQGFNIIWNGAVKFFYQHFTGGKQVFRLSTIQTAVPNLLLHLPLGKRTHFLRSVESRENACCNFVNSFIRTLGRKNNSNQQFKGRIVIKGSLSVLVSFFQYI